MSKIIKIVLIILAVCAIVGIVVFLISKNKSQTPATPTEQTQTQEEQTQNLATIKPEDYTSVLESNFKKAQEKALEWNKKAKFVYVKVQLSPDLNPKKVTETYVFSASDSPIYYWTIGFNLEGDYIRALINKSDFLIDEDSKEINTQYWKVDWITALQKADAAGGKAFRDQYKNDLEISLNLKYLEPKGYLTWVISYKDINSDKEFIYNVDAYSGEGQASEENSAQDEDINSTPDSTNTNQPDES